MTQVLPTPAPADPLFPAAKLLPLADPGGVQDVMEHTPGVLRPFSATLGVPRPPVSKKHDTTATKWSEPTSSNTSKDGTVVTDSTTDTYTDS